MGDDDRTALADPRRALLCDLTRLAEERRGRNRTVAAPPRRARAAARQEHEESRRLSHDPLRGRPCRRRADLPESAPGGSRRRPRPSMRPAKRSSSTPAARSARTTASARDKSREDYQEARWTVRTVYEAGKKEAHGAAQAAPGIARRAGAGQAPPGPLPAAGHRAPRTVPAGRGGRPGRPPPPGKPRGDDPFADLQTCVAAAKEALLAVRGLGLPRWFSRHPAVLGVPAAGPPGRRPRRPARPGKPPARRRHRRRRRRRRGGRRQPRSSISWHVPGCARPIEPLCQAVADGGAARKRCRAWVQRATRSGYRRRSRPCRQRRNQELEEVQRKAQQRLAELNRQRAREAGRVEKHYPPLLAAIRRRRDAALRAAESRYQQTRHRDRDALRHRHGTRRRRLRPPDCRPPRHPRPAVERAWPTAGGAASRASLAAVADINSQLRRPLPRLALPRLDRLAARPPPFPPACASARSVVRLAELPHGVPEDERLRDGLPESLTLPALLPFPNRASVLLRAGDDGPGRRRPRPANADAALPHGAAARQGALHHHRPGRPGRELRRLHAPGRLRRGAGRQPHLDRAAAHRAAAWPT